MSLPSYGVSYTFTTATLKPDGLSRGQLLNILLMNTQRISLLVVSVLLLFIGTSTTTTDTIYWTEDYKLTWNDFKGQPDYNIKSISALSSSGLMHSKGCKEGKIIYEVLSYFEKKESWVKSEAYTCLLYTSPSPRDATLSRMPSSA